MPKNGSTRKRSPRRFKKNKMPKFKSWRDRNEMPFRKSESSRSKPLHPSLNPKLVQKNKLLQLQGSSRWLTRCMNSLPLAGLRLDSTETWSPNSRKRSKRARLLNERRNSSRSGRCISPLTKRDLMTTRVNTSSASRREKMTRKRNFRLIWTMRMNENRNFLHLEQIVVPLLQMGNLSLY